MRRKSLREIDGRNALAILPAVTVNVELRHYNVECSSAKTAVLFREAIPHGSMVSRADWVSAARHYFSAVRKSASRVSITSDEVESSCFAPRLFVQRHVSPDICVQQGCEVPFMGEPSYVDDIQWRKIH